MYSFGRGVGQACTKTYRVMIELKQSLIETKMNYQCSTITFCETSTIIFIFTVVITILVGVAEKTKITHAARATS